MISFFESPEGSADDNPECGEDSTAAHFWRTVTALTENHRSSCHFGFFSVYVRTVVVNGSFEHVDV